MLPAETGNVTLESPAVITGATYGVKSASIVILEAQP